MTRVLRLALVLASAVVLGGCGGAGTDSDPAPAAGGGSAGGEAVEVAGSTVAGERLSLAELRGSVVFVNTWASW